VVEEASGVSDQVFSTGGRFLRDNRAFAGLEAEKFVRSVNIDILFFSSQGISATGEISDASEAETSLRRTLLDRSKRKVFLCDSSKVGISRMFFLCTRHDVDEIICDRTLPWEKTNNNQ
jgi:DeoR/GlpR family transcriptional regulator of sugar metabolism